MRAYYVSVSKTLSLLIIGVVFIGIVFTLELTGQNDLQLYFVTGLSTHDDDFAVPSSVFALDSRKVLSRVADLAVEPDGTDFILADHERRIVLAGTPHSLPTEVVVISMDRPSAPYRIPISVGLARNTHLLGGKGGALVLALLSGVGDSRVPTGVEVTNPAAMQRELTWEEYKNVRREGGWAPSDPGGEGLYVTARDGQLYIRHTDKIIVPMGIPADRGMQSETEIGFTLMASNDELVVIGKPNRRTNAVPDVPDSMRLAIYDKKTGAWHDELFERSRSGMRVFGHWLAVNEAYNKVDTASSTVIRNLANEVESPGRVLRQAIVNPRAPRDQQLTVNRAFAVSPYYFPGTIHLYNAETRKRYRLDTGQGDSEVLLIRDADVYYRVNDSLFRARIGTNRLENPVELVKDGMIQFVHWVFVGPAL